VKSVKLGVVFAHRGVMDRNFSLDRRARILEALAGMEGTELVSPPESVVPGGLVSGEQDAARAIRHFSGLGLEGVVLAVLGYGDEKSALQVVESLKGLPVLLFAMKEPIPDGGFLQGASLGGMLPISYGLHKRNIPFTFAGVFEPEEPGLREAVDGFSRVCAAVGLLRRARIGMIGFRPYDFEVCIFNEGLLLERYGTKTVPLNLIDLKAAVEAIPDGDPAVAAALKEIGAAFTLPCPAGELAKLAKLERVMIRWAEEYRLDALTIQCWPAIQEHIGLTPCLTNGRLTRMGVPVACEGDVLGALSMLMQRELTRGRAIPWLADILMLHPTQADQFLAWHCGNASAELAAPGEKPHAKPHCSYPAGLPGALAAGEFPLREGEVSLNRLVEHHGEFRLLHVPGRLVSSTDRMRGSWGWVSVENRERMLRTVVEEGFVHHVSLIPGRLGPLVAEAARHLGYRLVEA
jgi:L-fucose isomerase-like protein